MVYHQGIKCVLLAMEDFHNSDEFRLLFYLCLLAPFQDYQKGSHQIEHKIMQRQYQ